MNDNISAAAQRTGLRVAIVGRPNVGKSTLFNRLAGRKLALVHDQPGVTRDWREADAHIAGWPFVVIDTAGLEEAFDESLEARMRRKTQEALGGADLVLFVIDSRAGIVPMDQHFASWLRQNNDAPVWLIANKCEGNKGNEGYYDAFSLGLGEPIALSAEHGEGMAELYSEMVKYAQQAGVEISDEDEDDEGSLASDEAFDAREDEGAIRFEFNPERPVQMAVVGRPNAGKSTLVNAILGQDRFLTGPEAGITRDSISVDLQYKGRPIRLFDTAGLRRQARVVEGLEKMSVADSLRSLRYAQVVILLMDADSPLDKQDLTIARRVIDEGRALILAVNKWDVTENRQETLQAVRDRVERSMPQIKGVPILTLSALHKKGLDELMQAAVDLFQVWTVRFSTALLNRWLHERLESHPPPLVGGRRIKIRYITQAKTRPPTFMLFGNKVDELPDSYRRYLVNSLREDFNVWGTPIRLNARRAANPYAK